VERNLKLTAYDEGEDPPAPPWAEEPPVDDEPPPIITSSTTSESSIIETLTPDILCVSVFVCRKETILPLG
jgi:hypothetical protein